MTLAPRSDGSFFFATFKNSLTAGKCDAVFDVYSNKLMGEGRVVDDIYSVELQFNSVSSTFTFASAKYLRASDTALWVVSNGNNKLFVGGTIHVLRESDFPIHPAFLSAYDFSETVVFEYDPAIPIRSVDLEGFNPRLTSLVGNFFNQTIQQELFFFTLPFLIAATHVDDLGQMAFTLFIIAAAVISTVDPLYEKYIHRHRITNLAFHALCCFVSALVILPIVVKLPTDKTLLIALALVAVWLSLVLPGVLRRLAGWKQQLTAVLVLCTIPFFIWTLRASIPATGIVVTRAVITREVVDNEPSHQIITLNQNELDGGVYAFAAIRAPNGLTQRIVFRWKHDGWMEEIPARIEGGRAEGFRTYSRKLKFMTGSVGLWEVDILTHQGQLLSRLEFTVVE